MPNRIYRRQGSPGMVYDIWTMEPRRHVPGQTDRNGKSDECRYEKRDKHGSRENRSQAVLEHRKRRLFPKERTMKKGSRKIIGFMATVGKMGKTTNHRLVLDIINLETGEKLRNHMWIGAGKNSPGRVLRDMKPGTRIKFSGTICEYMSQGKRKQKVANVKNIHEVKEKP